MRWRKILRADFGRAFLISIQASLPRSWLAPAELQKPTTSQRLRPQSILNNFVRRSGGSLAVMTADRSLMGARPRTRQRRGSGNSNDISGDSGSSKSLEDRPGSKAPAGPLLTVRSSDESLYR